MLLVLRQASHEAELFQFRRGASALRACGVAVWSIRLWNALAWPFTKTQQGIVAGQTGRLEVGLAMSALECADQASPRACTVKPSHIATLTTKAFFGKCQMSFRSVRPLSINLYRPSKSRSILIRPVAIPVAILSNQKRPRCPPLPLPWSIAVFAKHSPPMLLTHFVGNAGAR